MNSFRCILADPPWQFRDRGSRINPENSGHYETMSLSAITGLGDIVYRNSGINSHLWLCSPNAFVIDGSAALVAKIWGFKPRQLLTWGKNRFGMGHWLRNQTEQILFCTRGKLKPLNRNVPTIFHGKVSRHSQKPAEMYTAIEQISPAPRLEMFARKSREGWASWGDQAPEETRIDL